MIRCNTKVKSNPRVTKFSNKKHLRFSFTIVFLIERKRRNLWRGVVLRKYFRVWRVVVSLRDGGTVLQNSTSAGKDAEIRSSNDPPNL